MAWLTPTPIHANESESPLIFQASFNPTPYGPQAPAPRPVEKKPIPKRKTVPKVQKVSVGNAGRYNPCSCVSFVKAQTGYSKSVGNARNWPVNSKTPTPGAVIVTYESRAGHVGIVSHSDGQYVYLKSEANYSRCKLTYGRKIPINSKVIKGYWN